MPKELVIINDGPSQSSSTMINISHYNLTYYLKFFERIHILFWSKEKVPGIFEKEEGKFIFYPHCQPYNSKYITGIKFMSWIGRTLWQICKNIPKDTKLILMPVIPIWAGLPTLIVGKIKRKKVVLRLEAQKMDCLRIEDEALDVPKIFTALKLIILKIVYFLTIPFYDYVIGISSGVLKEAKKYGAQKIIWIPISINTAHFKLKDGKETREKITILSVGQINKRKGFGEIIEALKILKKEDNIIPKLLIVGAVTNPRDEVFLREFQEMSKELNVEFRGWVPHNELDKIYNQADIFILASHVEALGIVIMEAMASGLPVVATKTSGAKDLVLDGETGFLVPIKDVFAIKEKIKILLENSDLRESMGRAGRRRIEELIKKIDENNKKLWKEIL